jgi:hypothetical protein
MPSKDGRTTEGEIAEAVLRYLINVPSGEATIADIKRHLTRSFRFTEADKEQSQTRNNEVMWEQLVRNIVSHRNSDGNYIHDGLLAYRPRRLAITDAGRNYVKRRS